MSWNVILVKGNPLVISDEEKKKLDPPLLGGAKFVELQGEMVATSNIAKIERDKGDVGQSLPAPQTKPKTTIEKDPDTGYEYEVTHL